jgi:AraC-like DNA-binding protein
MVSSEYTTLASWLLPITKALSRFDVNSAELVQQAGLDLEVIQANPETRVPISKMSLLWALVEQATGNSAFGLEVGRQVNPLHFRALGMLMMTSSSIAETFDKISEYYSLISNSVNVNIVRTPEKIGLKILPLESVEIHPMAIDAFFSSVVALCEPIIHDDTFIVSLALHRTVPDQKEKWEKRFNCPITFQADDNCLWMKRCTLERFSALQDPKMAMHSESLVQDYLSTMQSGVWQEKVSRTIHSELLQGEPSLADIAQRLNLSERSLSRKLKEEGTTFRALVKEKRKELAAFYLSKSEMSVTELAYKIGFSDVSNFNRAFQRWFGCSPSEYRKQHAD